MRGATQTSSEERGSAGRRLAVVGALTALALIAATLLMLASIASSHSSTAPLGLLVLPFIWVVIVAVGVVMGVVVRVVPRRKQPLVLATTVIPLVAGIAAVGVPEALQHHFRAEWSTRELYLASIVSVPAAALAAGGLSAAYRRSLSAPVLGALIAGLVSWAFFLGSWAPSWCPTWCQGVGVTSAASPVVTAEKAAGRPPRGRIEATTRYRGRDYAVLVWRRRGRLCWLGGRADVVETRRLERGGSCVSPESLERGKRLTYTRTIVVDRTVTAAEARRAFRTKRDLPGVEIVSGLAAADTKSLGVDGEGRPRLLTLSRRNRAFIIVYELSPRGQRIHVVAADHDGFRRRKETFAPPLRKTLDSSKVPVRRPLRQTEGD